MIYGENASKAEPRHRPVRHAKPPWYPRAGMDRNSRAVVPTNRPSHSRDGHPRPWDATAEERAL